MPRGKLTCSLGFLLLQIFPFRFSFFSTSLGVGYGVWEYPKCSGFFPFSGHIVERDGSATLGPLSINELLPSKSGKKARRFFLLPSFSPTWHSLPQHIR